MAQTLSDTIVVTGHYGSGKTNLSINLALLLREQGREVVLADLDIVNPYFRTADFAGLAEEKGIRLITPTYANSSVDIPSLTGALDAALHKDSTVIVDVGGDDDGAHALGRYAPRIQEKPYQMLFVANFFRYLTRTPEESAGYLADIEAASRLKVTHIVNNSNLSGQTTAKDVLASIVKAKDLATITGLPLLFTAVDRPLAEQLQGETGILPVDVYVKTIWQ